MERKAIGGRGWPLASDERLRKRERGWRCLAGSALRSNGESLNCYLRLTRNRLTNRNTYHFNRPFFRPTRLSTKARKASSRVQLSLLLNVWNGR